MRILGMIGSAFAVLACVAGCNQPSSTTVGTKVDDAVVTAKVKSALLADPVVKGLDVKVETRKGEVQLSGFVGSQAQIDQAVAIARGTEGVSTVDNKLTVKAVTPTVGMVIDDGVITTKVKAALLADADVKSFDIAVVTKTGEVQLSGFVDNPAQMDRAVSIVRGVEGVKSVANKMSVKK